MKYRNLISLLVLIIALSVIILSNLAKAAEPVDCWAYWSICSRNCEKSFPEDPTTCYGWCVDTMERMGCYNQ